MSHGTSHRHLTAVTFIFRFAFALVFVFMTHDMIQCGMTWQQILLCSHMIHVWMGLTNVLSHRFA